MQFSRISSVFNPARRHPVLNTIRAHRGVDYAAPTGTPVRAAGAGRVRFRGVKGGFGNVVEIAHAGRSLTRYGHLSRFAQELSRGSKVEQGQVIGYVGMTGLATGPHLHFEYIERGVFVDPQKAMRRAAARASRAGCRARPIRTAVRRRCWRAWIAFRASDLDQLPRSRRYALNRPRGRALMTLYAGLISGTSMDGVEAVAAGDRGAGHAAARRGACGLSR